MAVRRELVSRVLGGVRGVRVWLVVPWVVSVAVHGAVVGLAFFVVWTVAAPRSAVGPPAVVSFFDPAPARLPVAAPEREREAEEEPGEREVVRVESVELPSPASILEEALGPEEAEEVVEVVREDASAMYERRVPEVEFFGMGSGNAESIVYVVDGSGSMVTTLDGLKAELARSVGKLAPTQRFQVVFFQGDPETGEAGAVAAPHPSRPGRTRETMLIRATRANVAGVLEWVEGVRARGRSNPLRALEIAMALEPDAVFLLSNTITGVGEWEADAGSILARLEELNPADRRTGHRPVTLKVIALPPEDPSGLLRRIGERHGGEDGYTFIDRDELGKGR